MNETTKAKLDWQLTKLKIKARNVKDWTCNQAKGAIDFAKQNPELTIAGFGAAAATSKMIKKVVGTHSEKVHRKRRIYDPRRGCYCDMRREPNKREWLEIERRYDNKESYRSILNDMGLLK